MTVRPGHPAVMHMAHTPARPEHEDHARKPPLVTRPQIAAVAFVTIVALIATPLWAASKVNLGPQCQGRRLAPSCHPAC